MLRNKLLIEMSKTELMEYINALKIDGITKRNSEETMIEAIESHEDYNPIQDNTTKKEKFHPKLGKYRKCRVQTTDGISDIFVSINEYVAEFNAGTVVTLPQKVIDQLKKAGHIEHFYDAEVVNGNGTIGANDSRIVQTYFIDIIEE